MIHYEDCNLSNADVVVTADVFVERADLGVVSRIVSVDPADHPSRDKALEMLRDDPYFQTAEKPGSAFRKQFPYCAHPEARTLDPCQRTRK